MRRTRLWTLIAAFAIALAALVAAGCGGGNDTTGGGGGGGGAGADLGLKESGKLLVGSDMPYPPFEFGTPPTGYDVAVVDEIAKRLGLEATFQDTSFDTIFVDLAAGQFDMEASASTITPDREKTIDFSDPYYSADQALVVTPGSDIKTVADLDGKTVGAQDGTTGEQYANDKTDASSVQGYPQGPDAINALKAGQVEAVVIDLPVAQDAVEKQGGVEVATTIPTGELYGFGFPQDNDALREAFNKQLTAIKKDGTLDKIYQKYFGVNAPKAVINGTNEPK